MFWAGNQGWAGVDRFKYSRKFKNRFLLTEA